MWCFTARNRRNLKTNHRIPLDVIHEILSWLPAKSVVRFKCVCKEWCNLINSPLFAKLHLNKSLQSDSRHNHPLFCTTTLSIVDNFYRYSTRWTKLNWPKDLIGIKRTCYRDVIGSCNGLVCFKFSADMSGPDIMIRCFLICNPTTGTFKLILPSSEKKWTGYFLRYGFCYDSEHDDYKIVVTSSIWTESDRDVCIYSVKADLWRSPTTHPRVYSFGKRWETRHRIIIFKDEMLHYLVSADQIVDNGSNDGVYKDYRIARFDVVTEEWKDDLSLPKVKKLAQFGELDGRLYIRAGSYSEQVWMLQEEHGSRKKMFEIPKEFYRHRLVGRSKDGRDRLLFQFYCDFKWYDYKDNKTERFALKVPAWNSGVMFCMASLVTIPGCSSEKLHDYKEKKAKCRLLSCIETVDDLMLDIAVVLYHMIESLFTETVAFQCCN